MARELLPGVFTELFGELAGSIETRIPVALDTVARMVEDEAKKNASNGTHPYRTRTPASPGSGPAQISGTLVGSITHSTPEPGLTGGWSVKIGTQTGAYPPYRTKTPSSMYGYYLEVPGAGRSRVRYPFLKPAFHKVAEAQARVVFMAVLGG